MARYLDSFAKLFQRVFIASGILILLLAVCCLTSCGSSNTNGNSSQTTFKPNTYDTGTILLNDVGNQVPAEEKKLALTDEEIAAGAADGFLISVENVSNLNGLFCLSSDAQGLKQVVATSYVFQAAYYDDQEGLNQKTMLFEYGIPTVINRSNGEQLVMVGKGSTSSSTYLYKVTHSGYFQGTGIAGEVENYPEIGGQDTASPSFDISSFGVTMHKIAQGPGGKEYSMMTSPTPMSLNAGWFKGSSWIDGVINIDAPYYISYYEVDKFSPEIITTKNGYFIVDTSSLEPGKYILQSYFLNKDTYYIFEIV